jgi:diguanylate cyclase (GGDEF)-like protein
MRRRFVFASAGGLLSAGAPLGLLAVRLARRERWRSVSLSAVIDEIRRNGPDYIYAGTSTALALGVFGYLLGRHADWLAELSETDPLTGLFNARRLFDNLDGELARARRYREPLALLLVDLDGLKSVNDRFGHQAGDAAIRGLADVIRSELRETDIGARWGGDEFAVLAPNTSQAAALALAERIRATIPAAGAPWALSGSIGVAAVDPGQGEEVVDSATLMRAADAALYAAKRRGRNMVVSAPRAI